MALTFLKTSKNLLPMKCHILTKADLKPFIVEACKIFMTKVLFFRTLKE